jgi:hypothetical protein
MAAAIASVFSEILVKLFIRVAPSLRKMKQTNRFDGQESGHHPARSPQMNRGAALLCLRAKHIVKDLTMLKHAGVGAGRLVSSGLSSLAAIGSHSTGADVALLWRWRNVPK